MLEKVVNTSLIGEKKFGMKDALNGKLLTLHKFPLT